MAHSKLYKLLPPTVDSILPLCTDGDSHAHQQPTHFAEENDDTRPFLWASTHTAS